MRYAAISGGKITRITTSPEPAFAGELIVAAPDNVSDLTHRWSSGHFVVATMATPAPDLSAIRAGMAITPRQLFIGMVQAGFCTAEEGIAAATTGAMPAVVEGAIAELSPEDQIAARITWARMQTVERLDPLVGLLAAAVGITDAEVDTFFEGCASI
jgi:hypothetical protein